MAFEIINLLTYLLTTADNLSPKKEISTWKCDWRARYSADADVIPS